MPTAEAIKVETGFPPEPAYRLSVEQYHQMVEYGILTAEDQVELLDGWLVPKMTKTPAHVYAAESIREALARLMPGGWHVRAQDPLTVGLSEPEPDAIVVRGERRDYISRHPQAHETACIVEVADASLNCDRGVKKRIYAAGGIPAYWVVNLQARCIEVFTDPSGTGDAADYRTRKQFGAGESVALFLDDRDVGRIDVSSILPP